MKVRSKKVKSLPWTRWLVPKLVQLDEEISIL